MPLAIRPSLYQKVDMGFFMCTMILVHAVHMKARPALISLHKFCLRKSEKWCFTLSYPETELWPLDLQCGVLANQPKQECISNKNVFEPHTEPRH